MALHDVSSRDPAPYYPGYEINYTQTTASVNVVSTTEATGTSILAPGAIVFDGAPVLLHLFCWVKVDTNAVGDAVVLSLFEGATQITRLIYAESLITSQEFLVLSGFYRFTPTAASHTYTVTAFTTSTAGTPSIVAGSGGTAGAPPAFVRFTKV